MLGASGFSAAHHGGGDHHGQRAAAAALLGIAALGLVVASFAQILGAGETFLLRFSEPLVSDMFMTVTVDNLAAVVVMATGFGAAIGAATGPSSMLGVAGRGLSGATRGARSSRRLIPRDKPPMPRANLLSFRTT